MTEVNCSFLILACQRPLFLMLFFLLFRTLFHYGNITYDRRVIRGNVYAQNIISAVRIYERSF